jgi:hypothetical protein
MESAFKHQPQKTLIALIFNVTALQSKEGFHPFPRPTNTRCFLFVLH